MKVEETFARGNKQCSTERMPLMARGSSSLSSCFGLTTERCRSAELPVFVVREVDMIVIPRLIRNG